MKNNQSLSRFEINIDNHTVFANYQKEDNLLYITHVEAPEEIRGHGAAGKLMEEIAKMARIEKLKIVPICPYAEVWLKRHKEYQDVV